MRDRNPLVRLNGKSVPLPRLWLISDARNDDALESTLKRLPRGSGFVFRHYHLAPQERIARFFKLQKIAKSRGHIVILADSALTAKEWGADGIYGPPLSLYPRRNDLITIATAHNMREIGQANLKGANAIMLSPVFATRSHVNARTLGPSRFHMLAAHAKMPVIALGGMTKHKARALEWPFWAAIDGLSD